MNFSTYKRMSRNICFVCCLILLGSNQNYLVDGGLLVGNAWANSKQKSNNSSANSKSKSAPKAGQPGSPHQRLPQAPNAAQPGSPHQRLPQAPNAGQPGSPHQRVPQVRPDQATRNGNARGGQATNANPGRTNQPGMNNAGVGKALPALPPRRVNQGVASPGRRGGQAETLTPAQGVKVLPTLPARRGQGGAAASPVAEKLASPFRRVPARKALPAQDDNSASSGNVASVDNRPDRRPLPTPVRRQAAQAQDDNSAASIDNRPARRQLPTPVPRPAIGVNDAAQGSPVVLGNPPVRRPLPTPARKRATPRQDDNSSSVANAVAKLPVIPPQRGNRPAAALPPAIRPAAALPVANRPAAVLPVRNLPAPNVDRRKRGAADVNTTGPDRPRLNRTPARQLSIMSVDQAAPKVFPNQLVKGFVRGVATRRHNGMTQRANGQWIPRANQGQLGKYVGGGFNSRVYLDQGDPTIVHKLVPLVSFKEKGGGNNVQDLNRDVSITDQLGGRVILRRFKDAYKGKGLSNMVQIAEMRSAPTVWDVVGPNGKTHKFAHSREQNISSPVLFKPAGGRSVPILGDSGERVLATNGYERMVLRAKNKLRDEARRNGKTLKFSDILEPGSPPEPGKRVLRSFELNNVLTQAEEVTISTVIRGLNHNGIVWTDQKLQNLDIVRSNSSKTGYKVVFFDFDAFRAVNGDSRPKRKALARRLQTEFDHATKARPAKLPRDAFDYTAFGEKLPLLTSAGANRFRTRLSALDKNTPEQFNQILNTATRGQVKTTSPNF